MREDFYRSAMKEAPIGYACQRILCDDKGEPYDFEFVEVNSAFAECVYMEEGELIGRRYSETFPQLYGTKPEWLRLFAEIALSGGQKELELYSEVFIKWLHIKILSPEKYYFVLFLLDVSKEREELERLEHPEIFEERNSTGTEEDPKLWERRLSEIADVLKLEKDFQFQRIIENLPLSLGIISLDGIILYANAKFTELFELSESDLGRKMTNDLWFEPEKHNVWIETLDQQSVVNDFEMHLRTTSGKEFWAIGSGMLIQYQERSCVLATYINITERKRMESALKVSEEKYRLLTEFTSDVIWVLNLKKQKFTYISPSIYDLTGQTAEEALGMSFQDSLTPESAIIMQEAIDLNLKEFLKNPDDQKSYMLEIRQKHKNGDVIWVEVSIKYRFNDTGEIEIVCVSRNIEERKKAEREVLYLSYHDQLTGLYNRRFYEEELERINFQRNLPMTLAIADVNGLKLTNDAFGHFAGDDLLKKIAAVINRELRAEDLAARIGGDEFALLLPKTDSAGAEVLINRIKKGFRTARTENSVLSVSFGWATKETVEDDFSTLFIQAEDNMYHAKLIESMNMKNETIQLVMKRLYQKNELEQRHSERVGKLCFEIGKAMDLSKDDLWELELLGRMHDIGKIGIPDEILNKMKKLNEAEWLEIRRHPEIGYQILKTADEYLYIAEAVLSHHERADGKGYPRNLKLEEIPLNARILAIAEAYDVMRFGGTYKSSFEEDRVVEELFANAGTQFDGEIVRVFVEKVLRKSGTAEIAEA
jgi:diguanylate cyclase (GGDEF)-like protein/PAS domain S-box-containing protein